MNTSTTTSTTITTAKAAAISLYRVVIPESDYCDARVRFTAVAAAAEAYLEGGSLAAVTDAARDANGVPWQSWACSAALRLSRIMAADTEELVELHTAWLRQVVVWESMKTREYRANFKGPERHLTAAEQNLVAVAAKLTIGELRQGL